MDEILIQKFLEKQNLKENLRTIAKEQLEKLQICKMSYIQEYTCEFEEYYYKIFDSGKEMIPYLEISEFLVLLLVYDFDSIFLMDFLHKIFVNFP